MLVAPLFRNYCSLHILRVLSIHPDPNQVPKNKNISSLSTTGANPWCIQIFMIHDTSHTVWQRKLSSVLIITNFLRFELLLFSSRTPEVRSRKYGISAIKKPNQMANTLNFEAGNGNWWRPCNYERKLLIGPEHTPYWIHWHIYCSCVEKYVLKTVENRSNLVWIWFW